MGVAALGEEVLPTTISLTGKVRFEKALLEFIAYGEHGHCQEHGTCSASVFDVQETYVNLFDRRNEMFEIREMQDDSIYTVNLAQRYCICGHFQVERLLCCHVLACCANQHLDWQVYVHDVYKMSEICKLYRDEFVPMGDPSTWPRYERATKGRPKSTRYLNEINSWDMRAPQQCTLCGREGYSRSRFLQCASLNSARVQ
ncbi:hypothetical protein Ahy_B06g084996 [Arachis hypogaea]|uniref:SWIM-type domain-containing protein n=1 Tax=Arachis hypogaea TaxID=3818 RepID=A0A444YT90_ARAHY|nr:hypothetical protein Ahy_B06g084996 [Arachis hypogaea]